MPQIRVRLALSCTLDLNDRVLEMLNIEDDEPILSQVVALREWLEEDEENFSLLSPQGIQIVAIEVIS